MLADIAVIVTGMYAKYKDLDNVTQEACEIEDSLSSAK